MIAQCRLFAKHHRPPLRTLGIQSVLPNCSLHILLRSCLDYPSQLASLLLTAPLGARIGIATHSDAARQDAARALAESVVRRMEAAQEVDRNQLRLPI